MNDLTIGKELEYRYGIVTDSREAQASFLQSISAVLQLDQLAFAEGSPVSRAVEDKHGSARSTDGLEGLGCAVLVRKPKVRYAIARL